MSIVEFIRGALRQLHHSYDDAVADLSPEQLHWRANEKGLSAAFILWHYVRTEDNIIQFVLQAKPTVWIEGGWDQKLALHRTAQGTGMTLEDAQNLRITDKQAFLDYTQAVRKATDAFLANADDASLQQTTVVETPGRDARPERRRQHVPHPRLHSPGRDRSSSRPHGAERHGLVT